MSRCEVCGEDIYSIVDDPGPRKVCVGCVHETITWVDGLQMDGKGECLGRREGAADYKEWMF